MRYKHIHAHAPQHWTSVRSSSRASVHAVHSSVQVVRPSAMCDERGQDRVWCVQDAVRSREPSQCQRALDSWVRVPAGHFWYSSMAGHLLWQRQRRQAPPHGECGGVGVRRAICLLRRLSVGGSCVLLGAAPLLQDTSVAFPAQLSSWGGAGSSRGLGEALGRRALPQE